MAGSHLAAIDGGLDLADCFGEDGKQTVVVAPPLLGPARLPPVGGSAFTLRAQSSDSSFARGAPVFGRHRLAARLVVCLARQPGEHDNDATSPSPLRESGDACLRLNLQETDTVREATCSTSNVSVDILLNTRHGAAPGRAATRSKAEFCALRSSPRPQRRQSPGERSSAGVSCAPVGIRTPNLLIRSQMLYPLSYGRMSLRGLGNSSRWETPGGNRGPLLVT